MWPAWRLSLKANVKRFITDREMIPYPPFTSDRVFDRPKPIHRRVNNSRHSGRMKYKNNEGVSGMSRQSIRHALLGALVLMLTACGGGGGGGGGSSSSGGGFTISANPGSVSFTGIFGSGVMSQSITVSHSGPVLVYGSRPNESLPNWLTVSGGSGGTVVITASPDFVGSQSAVIRFGTGNISTDIQATTDVTVTATFQDGFGIPQGGIAVNGVWQTTLPPQQSLIVNNNGRSWRVADKSPWFTIDQMTGVGSAIVNLSFDTLAMPVGIHNGFVRFETTDGSLSAVVPVSLDQDPPHIFTMPDTLAVHVNSSEPASQTFKVHVHTETSGLALPFSIAPVDFLTFSSLSGTTGITEITVTAVPGTLPAGTHPQTFVVTVEVPGAATPKSFTAQLIIEPLRVGVGKNGVALTDGPDHQRLTERLPIEFNSAVLPTGLTVQSDASWLSASVTGSEMQFMADSSVVPAGLHFGKVTLRSAAGDVLDTINVGFYKFAQAPGPVSLVQTDNDSIWQIDPIRPFMYNNAGGMLFAYNIYSGEEVFRTPLFDSSLNAYVRHSALSYDGERLFYSYYIPGPNEFTSVFAEVNLTGHTTRIIKSESTYSLPQHMVFLKAMDREFVYVDAMGLYSIEEDRFVNWNADFYLNSANASIVHGGQSDEIIHYGTYDPAKVAKLVYTLERGAEFVSRSEFASVGAGYKISFSPRGDAMYLQSSETKLYEANSAGVLEQVSITMPYFSDLAYFSKADYVAALQTHLTGESAMVRYVDHQEVARINKVNSVWGVLTSSDRLRVISKELLPAGGLQLYATSLNP